MQGLLTFGLLVALPILALAAAILWLALETRKLRVGTDEALGFARSTLKLQEKATEDALRTAERHASTAAAASETTRQIAVTLRLGAEAAHRAWLSVDSITILTRSGRNFPVGVTTLLRNGGRTPAVDLEITQFYLVERALPQTLDFETPDAAHEGILGPGSSMKLALSLAYVPGFEAASRILEGQESVFLYGRARYRDILGTRRETTWAFRYDPDLCQFRPGANHNSIT
jgi:hypothetical protein